MSPNGIHNLCECGGPLLVRYDLETIRDVVEARQHPEWPRHHVALCPGAAAQLMLRL